MSKAFRRSLSAAADSHLNKKTLHETSQSVWQIQLDVISKYKRMLTEYKQQIFDLESQVSELK